MFVSACVWCVCVETEGTRAWRERMIIPISVFPVLSKLPYHHSEKVHFMKVGIGRSVRLEAG